MGRSKIEQSRCLASGGMAPVVGPTDMAPEGMAPAAVVGLSASSWVDGSIAGSYDF